MLPCVGDMLCMEGKPVTVMLEVAYPESWRGKKFYNLIFNKMENFFNYY